MILAASSINNSVLVVVLASAVVYGTPLLYAALGELLVRYRLRWVGSSRRTAAASETPA